MKQRIRSRVQEVLRFFNKKYDEEYELPRIGFFSDPEDVGMAYADDWKISFNKDFLKSHPALMCHDVVPHEVIHLIADKRSKPLEGYHGRTWCRMMREFGLQPKAHYEFN
jgi:predicted SprT family Zn-dependent metalloprotease